MLFRSKIPYLLMCETYRRDSSRGLRSWFKRKLVGWAVRNAAGVLPTGSLAETYLQDYGATLDRSFRLPNVPDVEALEEAAVKLRQRRHDARAQRGLSSEPVVLFVGRLIPQKRAAILIRAFARADESAQLVIVGDGPERAALVALANQLGLANRITFPGFVQPQEIPAWYAAADLFVLPSSETWGVVVLEALASGLPVIVTDEVGCHPDVVTNPRDGTIVRPGDEDALVAALGKTIKSIRVSRADASASIWDSPRKQFAMSSLAPRLSQALEGFVTRFHSRRRS